MKAFAILLAGVAVAAPGWGQQATPARPSVQQEFESATRLDEAKDFAGALGRWEALEVRTARNTRSLALVRVRKGRTLLALNRPDEALASIRLGLANLPVSDPAVAGDRFQGLLTLGRIDEMALDYASAAADYAAAERLAERPVEKLSALRGLAQTATFTDPAVAAQAIARADAVIAPIKTGADTRAIFRRLNGQLLLNRGDLAGARRESGEAVKLLGGLTAQTTLDDVSVRSNYAIASLLAGARDDARHYMAMTGAGRLSKGSFDPGPQMRVPECGGEAGLKPSDMAVIEFSIGDDGVVRDSAPVYAAGGGKVALDFARAARLWSWTPEQAKAMPLFFRNRVRVELRCSTAFERPSIASVADDELGKWLAAKKVALPELPIGSDAEVLPRLRAQLAAAGTASGSDALALVPLLHLLQRNVAAPWSERDAHARRELAILVANHAPPTAQLAVLPAVWQAGDSAKRRWGDGDKALIAGAATVKFDDDPLARSVLRLMIADATRNDARARPLLTAVGADTGLAANHPVRVAALVRLASLEQGAGDAAAASVAFAQSGLSARQCALVDSAPRFLSANAGSNAFPMEAMFWGFEGWTTTQFDVGADGKTLNGRVVVAYPPFVFSEAGAKIASNLRYEKSYRPDGGLGCGGQTQRVRFALPDG